MTIAPAKAIIHVVPTLHQYHAAAPGYGFDALTGVLDDLGPDVLVLELTERALRERRPQVVKQEYQHSVFPYLARRGIPAVAMEPDEALWEEFVTHGLEAEQRFRQAWPERHAAYERGVRELFDELLRSWDSPAAVNSARSDRVVEEKHARENDMFGPAYRDSWDRWNECFAQTIVRTAQAHPGRRVVAVAGFEHGYWLRRRLHELEAAGAAWTLAPRLSGEA
ncbi:hypothetical protein RAMLITH_10640 [Ramlibacter sp. RBP-2]|uniref:Uncharacterized protein n=1 Tax=Ramlibacter lithotrophicus TaxID=2606681 RepID=A0A7X6I6D7_9BURK|nr:hypothetical protein [Ramlibacter lithotrophicus]NKE66278.1 hypothetical protein [Ramlibacter lithotrophicus]